jgi:hypothetical protein
MEGSLVLRNQNGRVCEDQHRKFLKKGKSGMLVKPILRFPTHPNTSKSGEAREDDQRH